MTANGQIDPFTLEQLVRLVGLVVRPAAVFTRKQQRLATGANSALTPPRLGSDRAHPGVARRA